MQEESIRVAGEMQKLAMEQVQKEREEGDERLQKAVSQTEQRCLKEKLDAVQVAREEERNAAAQRATKIARYVTAHYQ